MTDQRERDLQLSVMPSVTIYSDGSYKPALGTGGYGTIMTCNGFSQFIYGGFVGTSNNAMELMGALSAIRMLNQPCHINIISDSQYVVNGINKYLRHWAANGWKKADGGQIANEHLWRELYLYTQHHIISATWVKGHAGNFSNATCDQFACIAAYHTANVPVPPHLLSIKRL